MELVPGDLVFIEKAMYGNGVVEIECPECGEKFTEKPEAFLPQVGVSDLQRLIDEIRKLKGWA